ncbi:MAG: TrmH family RNA methyltransferase [Candidatus Saccharimonadales bacterium]
MSVEDISNGLDKLETGLEIACENTLRDFNMGSIIRTANAFGVRKVHIVGRRQWNKRGAMATDKYLHVVYYESMSSFKSAMSERNIQVFAVENNCNSDSLFETKLPENVCLLFGQEGPGLSEEAINIADKVVHIDQFGSTRSMNVGHAAAIAMYEWTRQRRGTIDV